MKKVFVLPILAAALVFPAAAQADSITVEASEDTWVRSDQPSSTAGANDDEIWTQNSSGQTSIPTEIGLLKFNFTVPAGSTNVSATLTGRSNGGKSYAGTSNGPAVQVVGNSWSESTANYSTATGLSGATAANIGAVAAGAAINVPLNAAFTASTTTISLRLQPEGDDLGLWSSEAPTAANRPRLTVSYTPPTAPPVDTDGDGVPDSTDQCDTQPGPASNNGCPVVTPPPPTGLIPANAVRVNTNEWNGTPGSTFTTSQCPHAIPYMQDGNSIFARFQRNPGEPQSAGGYRCEQQSSTYIGKGEYWFEWRARYPNGYEPGCASWCTMRQWHENTSDGGGPVYLAMFMQNGRPQIDGQFVGPGTQSLDVDVRQWHTYTARINFQSNATGFAELWIDGVYSGRTTTNVTATPSNSYDKYGTYGGDSTTTRTADYDYSYGWRVP